MIGFLARAYRKTGIHGAPPGTYLHGVNSFVQSTVRRRSRSYATLEALARADFGGMRYYDVARLRRIQTVNGIALIFFLGVGDYLMATPMIEALHAAHPDLPIWAFVSSNLDAVNSPLVSQLLKINPLIQKVATYQGRPRHAWTEYDFRDALHAIPSDFAILPVVYDTDVGVLHRGTSMLETFGLPVELPVSLPIAYPAEMSATASSIAAAIKARLIDSPPRALVCTHFGARSSGYEYPYVARLVSLLLRKGFQVVSFTRTGLQNGALTEIDVSTITVPDSIEILRQLKACSPQTLMLSVNSLMWPVSAALDIPNLGLHAFKDYSVHQYLYPNTFIVTPQLYDKISPSRLFLAPEKTYEERTVPNAPTTFTDYKPEFVADSLCSLLKLKAVA